MNWDKIRKEFETTDITMADLAKKHGVKSGTLRSRKNREKWERNVATKSESIATPKKPKMVIENDGLTEQQKLFCLLYLQYFNATKAYQEVYQCDYHSARSNSIRLIAKDSIKAELARLKAELQQDVFLDIKDLVREYAKQAFANITDFVDFGTDVKKVEVQLDEIDITDDVDEDGLPVISDTEEIELKRSYVYLKNADEVDGTLIQEVKQGKDGVSVKLYDKQKAMDALMKYLSVDDLRIAQIEKARADAKLSEIKAQTNEDGNASVELIVVNSWDDEEDEDEEDIIED